MSRIEARFAELQQRGDKALVAYLVAGDSGIAEVATERAVERTAALMHALVEGGADLIEMGYPFSDPMAEGPVIQRGHERALAAGIGLRQTLAAVADFRRRDEATPVILMGYANPLERFGREDFAREAAAVGVDAALVVDMDPEESTVLADILGEHGLDMIFLVAPTTNSQRLARIAAMASGYLYYVSLKGVTGANSLDPADVRRRLQPLRKLSRTPICVGFGIRSAEDAAAVAPQAEGVVVGSLLVEAVGQAAAEGWEQQRLAARLIALLQPLRAALAGVPAPA